MKRVIPLLFLAVLLIPGCAQNRHSTPDGTTLIVTSFQPVERLVQELLHDLPGFEIRSIAPASAGCPHHYTLTPADVSQLAKASVIVGQGYGIDNFLLAEETRRWNRDAHLIDLSQGDPDLRHDEMENEHDHTAHTEGTEVAPHVWVSPVRVAKHAALLADSLALFFPLYADTILARGNRLNNQLTSIHEEFVSLVEAAPLARVASMHSSFDILAADIGLEISQVVQTDPTAAPGPRSLERVLSELRQGRIAALLSEPQMEGSLERTLAKEAGVRLVRLESGVAGSADSLSILSMHETNLRTLRGVLVGNR